MSISFGILEYKYILVNYLVQEWMWVSHERRKLVVQVMGITLFEFMYLLALFLADLSFGLFMVHEYPSATRVLRTR